eukprot:Nitzschia sp. Nitz4//scaffold76_size158648//86590//88056//NITZ4_002551-RA/size158648-processed-gene-0.210-mRNA-1//-1//CDS//3329557860//3924//frame0
MPSAAAYTTSSQPMVGYGASPANLAMDVESPHNPRSKYTPHPQYQSQGKPYDSRASRSSRGREDLEDPARPRSGRSSSHTNSQSQRYHPQAAGGTHHYQSRQGPTSAPNMTPSQHFTPPPHYGQRQMATPPPDGQPTFPPPAVTSESPSPSESAQRRPAYLLHRDLVIGKGSYGQVCIASRGEAEGHSSGRSGKRKKFACKCVMLRNDPKYISKLQEEVNVLRELRGHDNVIRLYDVFCVDNELFIITELGRGGDLFHLLTTHPKHGVTESYAAKTVAEMLSAVAFLHARSICHRDLKLENWVLESGKDVWSPLKLIDFGLSTHFSPGQRLSRVVGSSYYVAPEVLKKSYTEACDLWSLGVIVYMLLSGAPPFYGKNDEAIKASIVRGEYTFPHELFRDVSDEAMAFVSTLLSYNIEYRYTAEQALTHPWLAANCDHSALQKAKDGARASGIAIDSSRLEPMQL